MTCPAAAPAGGGPYRAARFAALARGRSRFARPADAADRRRRAASAQLAAALDPLARLALHAARRPTRRAARR